MIYIARSLGLAPILIAKFGPIGNHLLYIVLVYFAIKRLTTGKYLMASIAMVPTMFVLSTTYGYDFWLIGFMMLCFAYFIYEVQNPDDKISKMSVIIMLGSLLLGLAAKAIYFPVIALLYLIKKEKFNTTKGHRYYIVAVTLLLVFVVGSFILPFLTSGGGGEGDWRGGEDVNSSAQTMFILQNPFAYALILLGFLQTYLKIFTENYITYFAHLGYSSFFFIAWLVIVFTALTDRNEKDRLSSTVKNKLIITIITFVTIVLFTTSMYVLTTEVGSSTIYGVQPRYKLPLLFPFLYLVGSFNIQNNIKKATYSTIVFGTISFILLVGAWEKFVAHLYTLGV